MQGYGTQMAHCAIFGAMPNPKPKRHPAGEWKKGQTGNPKGSSAKARAIAKVKRMSADDLADLIDLLLRGTRDDVTAVLNDPSASMIRAITARLLEQCLVEGDVNSFRQILDRVVGKPKESKDVSLTGADGQPVSLQMRVEEMTRDEKLARAKALAEARLALDD